MTRNPQDQPLEGGTCSSNNGIAVDNYIQTSAGIASGNNLDAENQTTNSTDGEQNLQSSDGNKETSAKNELNNESNKCEEIEYNDVGSKNGSKSDEDDDQCQHQLRNFEQDTGYMDSYDLSRGTSNAVNHLDCSSNNVDQMKLLDNCKGNLQLDKISSPLKNKENLNSSSPFSLRLDENWSQKDSELLENIVLRYELHKWKYIQAAFYNYTGRMIDAEIIQSYYNDISN
ncbi:BgTH12-02104 [Blumeria graminis f. sp. triticale]|uniref:Bgt-4060 n=3 Tax=Blumeria graminis TaxID=34373 RepID=A0A061HJB4_BLUGR|nr:hypothetical protein BGT96224_4060 [Blumeria graminis f. sp. tritici 96224]CAD6501858.1 BgTH12-02104 [Blumeria graminis f. sp. triticale]VDB85753.1 Bgt-4060 [Blumeria graminis f. sp. tritici]